MPEVNSPRITNQEETRTYEELFPFTLPRSSYVSKESHDVQEEPDFERIDNINAFQRANEVLFGQFSSNNANALLSNAVGLYEDMARDIQ